jgi:hypothetical protein
MAAYACSHTNDGPADNSSLLAARTVCLSPSQRHGTPKQPSDFVENLECFTVFTA